MLNKVSMPTLVSTRVTAECGNLSVGIVLVTAEVLTKKYRKFLINSGYCECNARPLGLFTAEDL